MTEAFNFIIKQFDTNGLTLRISRIYIDDFAADSVGTAFELGVVARVLQFSKTPEHIALIDGFATFQMQDHFVVLLRVTETIYR